MSQAKFEKIGQSSKALYGPRKLLLYGFPAGAQPKFQAVLEMAGMARTPKIWVGREQAEHTLADLFTLPDNSGSGTSSALPRAVITAGIAEKEIIALMTVCKKSGMTNALWAALTPTSQRWNHRTIAGRAGS